MRLTQPGIRGVLAGILLVAAFIPLIAIPASRTAAIPLYLVCFLFAGAFYVISVILLKTENFSLGFIWVVAIFLRLFMLSTNPVLSDDIYRYHWDGHLLKNGINPYAEPVNSAKLDPYSTPFRERVNHPEMASPYLPVALAQFWFVELIAPQEEKAMQFASITFDLLTGLIIIKILGRLSIKKAAAMLYLWNPLIIVEFSHSAHVDSLMLFFSMLAWYFIFNAKGKYLPSSFFLGLATLTKGIAVIFAPLWLKRWKATGVFIYMLVVMIPITLFTINADWGLLGKLDGTGVFGALRIYSRYWQFNQNPVNGILTSFRGFNDESYGLVSRGVSVTLFMIIIIWSGIKAWKMDSSNLHHTNRNRSLIRLSLIPIGAFVILSPTVHPWYVTLVVAFLPFFYPSKDDTNSFIFWVYPWIWFSLTISLTYLVYLNPSSSNPLDWVVWVEYLPLFGGLIWAWRKNRNTATNSLLSYND